MALLRGVGEMCRSRKIPQIGSEQHAKQDFKIIDDLRRGRKIKSASLENEMLVQKPSVKRKRRVRTTGCNGTSEYLPQATDKDRQEGKQSSSTEFSLWGL